MNTLFVCLCTLVFSSSPQKAMYKMTKGIDSIPILGTPGTMSVWGDDAFSVIIGNNKSEPVAVAAEYGDGRFFAIAHGSYISGVQDGTSSKFMSQVAKWVGNKTNPRIETLSNDTSNWEVADVLMFGQNTDLTPENETALLAWVHEGGGVIASACPWGWAQVTKKNLRKDLSQNRVMATLGMQYGGSYARGVNGVFAVEDILEQTHAATALRTLRNTGTCSEVGSNAILYAVHSSPVNNRSFIEEIKSVVSDDAFVPPTSTQTLNSSDILGRLYVALYTHEWKSGGVITAAQGSEVFPGTVDKSIERVEEKLILQSIEQGWQSTGLYLSAGDSLNLKVLKGNSKGWTLRIGCHKDQLWGKSKWQRWPEITHTVSVTKDMTVATPWGGLLYFIPSKEANEITVSLDGVVESPLFESTKLDHDWLEERKLPGPWAELKGKHMVITVPSTSIRDLDDAKAVTDFWDTVWSSHCELAGVQTSNRLERFVADQQISAGYMHSGYPIMTWLDVATPKKGKLAAVIDVEHLTTRGSWGHFHELGHNRQRGWWTFGGTGEVTCNLFSLHAGEVLCGIEPWENPWLQGLKNRARKYLEDGADFANWKSSPGIALISYAQLQREFGWEPFTNVFKQYEAMQAKNRPSNNQDKMDEWVRRMSIATNHDLRPFYEMWGMPMSESLKSNGELSPLQVWMPDPL